jgi:parallel beta-helix repeat protein
MKAQVTLVSAALILGLAVTVSGTVLHVPDEYSAIQAGIDAAAEGDTVLVADGVYTGDGNRDIDFGGKAIVVMSENGPEVTIINCEGSSLDPHRGFYFHSGEDSGSVLRGFTIRHGWEEFGGGILSYYSSPTIEGNKVTGNTGDYGGGICSRYYSSATIENNRITENTATYDGGGIYCWGYSSPSIEGNTITGNTAGYGGGGICCWSSTSPSITRNTIMGNSAAIGGGGIYCRASSLPTIDGNTITGNKAGPDGGGGIYGRWWCSLTVINSIVRGDTANVGPEICVGDTSSITISYSDVEGGASAVHVAPGCTLYWGEGNIDEDPMFVLADRREYRFLWDSPCIDSGHPDSLDPDGTRSDMGAHFFDQDDYMTLYLTPDVTEVSPGGVLGVTYTVINRWGLAEPFWVLTEATLPNGNTLTIMGPDQYVLPAGATVQRYRTHSVPGGAPFGLYEYRSRIGVPPATLYDEDRFDFVVAAP